MPRGVEPVCSPVVRCYVEDLVEEDVDVVDGVRVTSPMRTAVDLARWLPRGDALAAVDAFAHQQLVDLDALAASLQRWKGHAFVLQAREVIALGDGRSESWGESMTRLRLHDAGFDMPDLQVQLTIEGRQVRLDFGWRRERKALEYDGERWHSSAEQRRHDDERRRLLTRAGWEVAVVTKEHVLGRGRHFEEVVCRLTGQTPRRFAA